MDSDDDDDDSIFLFVFLFLTRLIYPSSLLVLCLINNLFGESAAFRMIAEANCRGRRRDEIHSIIRSALALTGLYRIVSNEKTVHIEKTPCPEAWI